MKDESTGLQYMNARYYNPESGRFLSQDTYSGSAYEPWTQHLYSYCGNNPTSMVDPTGHSFFSMFFKGLGKKKISKSSSAKMSTSSNLTLPWWLYNIREKSVQHKKVQNAIAAKYGGQTDVYIKGASSKGRDDTWGKADVISGDQIWEVKAISYQKSNIGRRQLDRYINKYEENYGVRLNPGMDPKLAPIPHEDAFSYGYIHTYGDNNGLVYYEYKPERMKEPAPAIAPETEKQPQKNLQPATAPSPSLLDVGCVVLALLFFIPSGGSSAALVH